MYIQTIVLKKKKHKQRRGQSLFLSVAREEEPWVLEERQVWWCLAALGSSCTRDKKLARPATDRLGWFPWHESLYLAILHRPKKNLPVFLTFQLLAFFFFFCLHPVLQTLNLLLLVSE